MQHTIIFLHTTNNNIVSGQCRRINYSTLRVWTTPEVNENYNELLKKTMALYKQHICFILVLYISGPSSSWLETSRNRTAGRLRTAEWRKNVAQEREYTVSRDIFSSFCARRPESSSCPVAWRSAVKIRWWKKYMYDFHTCFCFLLTYLFDAPHETATRNDQI